MSKATDKLIAARGDFTYEQVAKATGLTADQVRRTEQAQAFDGPAFWLLALCDIYGLGFAEIAALREYDTRVLVGGPLTAGPLQTEQSAEQTAMDFL